MGSPACFFVGVLTWIIKLIVQLLYLLGIEIIAYYPDFFFYSLEPEGLLIHGLVWNLISLL